MDRIDSTAEAPSEIPPTRETRCRRRTRGPTDIGPSDHRHRRCQRIRWQKSGVSALLATRGRRRLHQPL